MLKITTRTGAGNMILELEGRLAGPWVDELARCWSEVVPGPSVKILLTAVTFIDDDGKKLLLRLYESGAELQAEGCMTKCIVQEIIGAATRK